MGPGPPRKGGVCALLMPGGLGPVTQTVGVCCRTFVVEIGPLDADATRSI